MINRRGPSRPFPFYRLPGEQMAALRHQRCGRASRPSRQFPEKAGGPGTRPLVPQSWAFSGLQEVTSLSLCTGNMCVSVSLCPQAGPPDLWRH